MVAPDKTITQVIGWFHEAADVARSQSVRRGSLVELPRGNPETDVLVTADLHGQRLHYQAILKQADLENHRQRHLVMQEVCHGGPQYPGGGCMSHLLLEDVARQQIRYPERFHYLLSNHELAEVTDYPITKGNRMLNLDFRRGLQQIYGDACDDVRDAAVRFLSSCPLAMRLPNGVFISHSAPAKVDELGFDVSIFDRDLETHDLSAGGEAFRLVWGRDFREENAQAFASAVDAEVLIQGHEPCPDGFMAPNSRQVILDCCGPNASCALVPAEEELEHAEVVRLVRPLLPRRKGP